MSTSPAPFRSISISGPAGAGFVVGFTMTFLATFLALAFVFFERVHAVLVPASVLLRPLADRLADWNAVPSMTLGALVNGVVYAAAFTLVAVVWRAASHRGHE